MEGRSMADENEIVWRKVARLGDVSDDDVIQVTVEGRCLALFNIAGQHYVTSGVCTHAHALLAQGYLQDDTIECPLHQGVFHVPTGRAMSPPATQDLETYPVRVADGAILVGFDRGK
jgi:nitrite reductase/ring-hydroxylating ferredoxin subunit